MKQIRLWKNWGIVYSRFSVLFSFVAAVEGRLAGGGWHASSSESLSVINSTSAVLRFFGSSIGDAAKTLIYYCRVFKGSAKLLIPNARNKNRVCILLWAFLHIFNKHTPWIMLVNLLRCFPISYCDL